MTTKEEILAVIGPFLDESLKADGRCIRCDNLLKEGPGYHANIIRHNAGYALLVFCTAICEVVYFLDTMEKSFLNDPQFNLDVAQLEKLKMVADSMKLPNLGGQAG